MYRIKKAAIAQALQENALHTLTAYPVTDGFILTINDNAMLETERGEIRTFAKLDTLFTAWLKNWATWAGSRYQCSQTSR